MAVYYRTKQVRLTFTKREGFAPIPPIIRWRPQWSHAESGEWSNFSARNGGYESFVTPEEAESFLAARNPKWKTLYEGQYPLKSTESEGS